MIKNELVKHNDKTSSLAEVLDTTINLPAFGLDVYPEETQKSLAEVRDYVRNNTSALEIFSDSVATTGTGTNQSNFLSMAVQLEDHWTPYRKLRQILLELDNKLQALRTAKNNRRKTFISFKKIKKEIEILESVFVQLVECDNNLEDTVNNDDELTIIDGASFNFEMAMKLSMIDTTFKAGIDSTESFIIIPKNMIQILESGTEITDVSILEFIAERIKTVALYKIVELDDVTANLNAHIHMVRDAETAAAMYVAQGKKIESTEIPEWKEKYKVTSYEESEIFYYVMYFLHEYEKQIRTGDRWVDRGTEGAVTQLPIQIQKHIYKMRDYIRNQYYPMSGTSGKKFDSAFLTKENPEMFYPSKTGDHEWEGFNISQYMGIDFVSLNDSLSNMSKSEEE